MSTAFAIDSKMWSQAGGQEWRGQEWIINAFENEI